MPSAAAAWRCGPIAEQLQPYTLTACYQANVECLALLLCVSQHVCRPSQVVSRVAVGPNPVHIYSVSPARETWSHSDLLGETSCLAWSSPVPMETLSLA